MHLKSIRAQNYLNLRATVIEIPATANTVLIAGPNGSGKSGLIDAIRFVLTGDLPRGLAYKKELPLLITEGEKDGWVGATLVNGEGRAVEYKIGLKTGSASNPAPLDDNGALAVAPQVFMQLDPNKRRRALFELHGVSLKQADIVEALVKDGHDAERVGKIKTALGGGFDAAAKRAKELASEARGAWQATTGESYGAQKGKDWHAAPPAVEEGADPKAIAAQLADKHEAVIKATRQRDSALYDERQHAGAETARLHAAGLAKAESALATHDEKIADAKAKVDQMQAAAAAAAGGWTAPCPCCGKILKSQKPGQLEEYDETAPTGPRAAAAAEAASAALSSLTDERVKLAKAVDGARAAKLMLDRLPPRPSAEELAAFAETARTLTDEMRLLEQELATAKQAQTAEIDAARATSNAAAYHADVEGYNALSAAVEALPAKFLTTTLTRVNESLEQISRAFGERVQMGADMELRYGTISYRLLSESQRWRSELALGIALAWVSGAIVLMDRFDMVQPSDRGAILQMLGAQTAAQVVIGATLKKAPELPPESGLFVHWMGA